MPFAIPTTNYLLTDNLTTDYLLYADDVKLIAPRKQADALQSSLFANPQPNPATPSLTTRTSPNPQPIQAVSSVRNLGFLLNTGFSVDDVARATKKPTECFFA